MATANLRLTDMSWKQAGFNDSCDSKFGMSAVEANEAAHKGCYTRVPSMSAVEAKQMRLTCIRNGVPRLGAVLTGGKRMTSPRKTYLLIRCLCQAEHAVRSR